MVHGHLGKGLLPDVHTKQDAEQHIRSLVERMVLQTANDANPARSLFHPAAMPHFNEELEAIRCGLCETNADVRLVAIVELGRSGTLDDISLISDLLALPPQKDEDPFERHVLLTAMKNIIRRLTGDRQRGQK